MAQQKRTVRPLRLTDAEAAPIIAIAAVETEGNFSMAIRRLVNEALAARGLWPVGTTQDTTTDGQS